MDVSLKSEFTHPVRSQWLEFLFLAVLLIALGFPQLIGLGRFVTADEPTWGKLSANFYYALSIGDYAATYQIAHPSVTTLLIGAIAYHVKFPEYRRYGQVQIGDTKLFQIFQRRGLIPIELLATARVGVVVVNIFVLLIAYYFARRLWDRSKVWFGFLLIAFDPFYTAHSRIFHVDALLTVFLFASLLAFLWHLQSGKVGGILISGFLAGLGCLPKTPALILFPVVVLLGLLAWRFPTTQAGDFQKVLFPKSVLLPLCGWLLGFGIAFYLFFPAMWSDPMGTLAQVIGYTLESSRGMHGGAQFVDAFESSPCTGVCYLYFYPYTYLWRTTPLTLGGLILAGITLLRRGVSSKWSVERFVFFGLLSYALNFTLVMSLASKKFDRYLLPIYLPMDMIAGWGWVSGVRWLNTLKRGETSRWVSMAILVGVIVAQMLSTLSHTPYCLTYYNPWMGGCHRAPQEMMIGWGEGLDRAALFLKAIPDIQQKRVVSWYALSFNWYSLTLGFQADPIPVVAEISEAQWADLVAADYAVVYVNQWQRHMPKRFMDFIEQRTPQHSIWLKGMEYVRIYHLIEPSP